MTRGTSIYCDLRSAPKHLGVAVRSPFGPWRFTVIELLVVIGVLLILASFLLPALQNARGKAKQVLCTSNLRQMVAVAVGVYPADYDGVIVPAMARGPSTRATNVSMYDNSLYAVYHLHGYSVSLAELLTLNEVDTSTVDPQPNPLMYCPADRVWTGSHYNGHTGWWGMINHRHASYAINWWLSHAKGGNTAPPVDPGMLYMKAARVNGAEHKVALVETHYHGVFGVTWEMTNTKPDHFGFGPDPMIPTVKTIWAPTGAISFPRHGRGFNVSFVDGHVEYRHHSGAVNSPWSRPLTAKDRAEMEYYWKVE